MARRRRRTRKVTKSKLKRIMRKAAKLVKKGLSRREALRRAWRTTR